MTKRGAIYCRVSSQAQAAEDKTSLPEQLAACETYCQDKGITIAGRFTDVASGVSRERPQFRALQAGAAAGDFKVIVCWAADRLARSGSAMGDLLDALAPHGVTVAAVRGTFDLKYAELLASIARLERQTFVERASMGRRGAAKLGRLPGGRPLYGFRRGADNKPEIDEMEAAVVSRLFHLYANERQGVPTIMRRLASEYGFTRTVANTYSMLRNPAYAGTMRYQEIEIPCPPIVSRSLWDKTQDLLTKKTIRASRGNTKANYLLQQTITCGGCGRILAARTRREKNGRTLRYYRCTGWTVACRPRPYIRADKLEAQVWHHVRALLARPDAVVERFKNDTNGDTLADDVRGAEKDVLKWTRRNDKLIALYVQDTITQDEFDRQRKYVQEPLEAAQERLTSLRDREEQADTTTGLLDAFKRYWIPYVESIGIDSQTGAPTPDGGPLDAEGRKAVIRQVVESAVIDADNQLRYLLRAPDAQPPQVSITSTPTERRGGRRRCSRRRPDGRGSTSPAR